MGLKLEGKPVVQYLRENIKNRVSDLVEKNITPTLLIIRVGQREDDISYERSILKNCELLGIKGQVKSLLVDVSMEDLTKVMEAANKDSDIHGIMIFRPLPNHLDIDTIKNIINPLKDVDCMSPINLQKVFEGNSTGYAPCTPKAVVELLKYYKIPLKGANVVVAGRSLVVGKPLSMLLLDENATVTICHSRTKDMPCVTAKADIVVAAIGKAKFMDEKYFTANSIVVDVGINVDDNGKMCGDVDFDSVFDKVQALNPAIGGVGIITTTILLDHVIKACEKLSGIN
ncbi:bifunctional 5,10-methylenetetrahydrofolate dehydrogenase/5,10-methenyltetrahydrofolate cyclohydrolase [Clostridium sp.]|uniref:bifunctional 5,10-methylenetetrahydrofolate dehydrogenase/5,10-methenyltetrahydrofolate cyclohydrolase n=1 Tax=Clostridium sp. TaxID=1506 RepID=UPI002FCC3092